MKTATVISGSAPIDASARKPVEAAEPAANGVTTGCKGVSKSAAYRAMMLLGAEVGTAKRHCWPSSSSMMEATSDLRRRWGIPRHRTPALCSGTGWAGDDSARTRLSDAGHKAASAGSDRSPPLTMPRTGASL